MSTHMDKLPTSLHLLRLLFASLAPFILYTWSYLIANCVTSTPIFAQYFNIYAWLTIGLIALVNPLS